MPVVLYADVHIPRAITSGQRRLGIDVLTAQEVRPMKHAIIWSKILYLQQKGAGIIEHSGSTLLSHLLGTYNLLKVWGARPELCDAGLFHSIYGTESFEPVVIQAENRSSVQEVIGAEAEALVYLFSHKKYSDFLSHAQQQAALFRRSESDAETLHGKTFGIRNRLTGEWMNCTSKQLSDLVNVTIANALEQAARLPNEYRREDLMFLRDISSLALPTAQRTLDDMFDLVR